MKIAGVALDDADVSWLEQLGSDGCSRTHLAERLCARKGILNDLGHPRVTAARIDIGRAANRGALRLPPLLARYARPERRRKPSATRACRVEDLPRLKLAELGRLEVQRVEGASDPLSAVWNECLQEHHYLGPGPLCGAQLRYLVFARDRVVAALSFSAAARHLAVRDEFIGWSPAALRKHRKLVIQQSRFCLAVRVKNLASRVHSRVLQRVAPDWQEVYGYRPVLVETYVDIKRFDGASYRAANWRYVGETSGRGRQDFKGLAQAGVKSLYVCPLEFRWKEKLCREPVRKIDPMADWAQTEWGELELGDRRLTQRVVTYGRACFEKPTASTPQACGSRAGLKAAYRLLNHPQVSMEALLSTHREASIARAAAHERVFVIEDTTSLNYSTHPATKGLGPISNAEGTRGLQLHTSMLASTNGLALGILDAACWARDPESYGTKEERRFETIFLKESYKWLRGYAAANEAAERLEKTEVVVICDREADIYELFQKASKGRAHLLVRAAHPRRIVTEAGDLDGTIWDCLDEQPIATTIQLEIPRSGTSEARSATLDIRFREVRLAPPKNRAKGAPKKHGSIRVWAISAVERSESADEREPICWRLLTTKEVTTGEEAFEKVQWYSKRWLIEVFHRTLKSGCQVEQRQSRTAATLQAALAIDMVVAWRVMHLTQLGREVPQMPCTVFFEEAEWKALCCFVSKTSTPPSNPPTLQEALRMVASLGGFLGRNGDGHPGTQVIWRGLERLSDIAAAYKVFVLT